MAKRMDPEEFRLQGLLKEAGEHLDKLEALLARVGCDEFAKEFQDIRQAIDEIWQGR